MNTIKILTALLLMSTGTRNCEENDDTKGVVSRDECATLCHLPTCDLAADFDPDTLTQCTDRCISKGTDAENIGQVCADTYSRAVGCVANLDCPQFLQWAAMDDEICSAEITAFTESCPGMTFDFRE